MNNYTYVIADVSEVNNVNYSQVLQTSAQTVRKNIEQTRFVLKYDGDKPSTIQDLDNNGKLFTYSSKKYFTHSDILNIMTDAEWTGTQSYLG